MSKQGFFLTNTQYKPGYYMTWYGQLIILYPDFDSSQYDDIEDCWRARPILISYEYIGPL